MNFNTEIRNNLDEKRLPGAIYKSVVESLYADSWILFLGTLCMAAAPMVLYWKTNDPVQIAFSGLFLLLGLLRLIIAWRFRHFAELNKSKKLYAAWETRYMIGGSAYVTLLGLWFFVGFARSSDPFVQLMSLSLSLCYLIGIIGRNFGSGKVVRMQVLPAGLFLISAFLLFGNIYHAILAGFLLPFFITIWLMSARIRNMLFHAELTANENRIIADRFDMALDNIAHGVGMFEKNGTIVVANDRFVRLAGLGETDVVGSNVSALAGTRLGNSKHKLLADEVVECLKNEDVKKFSFEIGSGETVEADYYPVPAGGVLLLADISERVASEKAIRKLASFDPLTNLPNRRFFVSEVERLVSTDGVLDPCAMFFVDLDKFKQVNDTLGHTVGDKLLRATASRLRMLLPGNGLICRFGGDEFVIVIPGMRDHEDCAEFAETIIQEIGQPVMIDANHINIDASIGISLAPEYGHETEQLLQHADTALYDAKACGRSTYSFYTDELGEKIQTRRELEIDLRIALANKELVVHYQPLVNIKRNRITTCEALLRWEHRTHGTIPPTVFITIAEEIGLISELGEYVLREATAECKRWPDDVRVAVNVSSLQFQQSDVSQMVQAVLEDTGLDPRRLEIEVTESATLENIAETTETLNQISRTGVRISLDDFGTGFSSLSYLHSLPLDKVKIDRSFIADVQTQEQSLILLSGVVDLTRRLGLAVVLEGIETEEQMNLLLNTVSVDEIQGFLIARALPVKDIRSLLGQKDHFSNVAGEARKLAG